MDSSEKILEIRTSPHMKRSMGVEEIMRNVVLALLPVAAFAVFAFGLSALMVLSVSTITCVLSEHFLNRLSGNESTVYDWSAVITGLLFGLTLPPTLPLWMVAFGGFVAIGLGKFLFGGLGFNAFNPALVGRAVLQAAFPVALTTWSPAFTADRFQSLPSSTLGLPFVKPQWDAITTATPLGALKFDGEMTESMSLVMGLTGGSTGETSSILILLGGAYLVSRKLMNWRIPVAIFASVALLSGILHWFSPDDYPGPVFMLFSGGLMLGAVFMATDMVASPLTSKGVIVYGCLIGLIIVVIRLWSGLPEGVMYAILFANACSPHIDRLIQPITFGTSKRMPA